MNDKLEQLRKATEALFILEAEKLKLMRQMWKAINIDQYRKKHPDLKEAVAISFQKQGEALRTFIITNDKEEITKFSKWIGRYDNKYRKEYPDLDIVKVTFEDKSTITSTFNPRNYH